MKKLLLSLLCLSSSFAHASDYYEDQKLEKTPVSSGVSLPQNNPQEVLDRVCQKIIDQQRVYADDNLTQFGGAKQFDLGYLKGFRKLVTNDPKTFAGCYHDLWVKRAQDLKEFILNVPGGPQTIEESFLNEIDLQIKNKTLTLDWLHVTALRYLACKSDIKEESLSVFNNTEVSNLLDVISVEEARKSFHSFLSFLESHSEMIISSMFKSPLLGKLSFSCLEKIEEYLRREAVYDFSYLLFAEKDKPKKFGVSFLTVANWMNSSPISVTHERVTAHGLDLSPVEFGLHDYAHKKVDRKTKAVLDTVTTLTNKHLEEGGTTQESPRITKAVADHFKVLQTCMLLVQKRIMDKYYLSDPVKYNEIVNGSFWAEHEYSTLDHEDLLRPSFSEIIKSLSEKVQSGFTMNESWENSYDPLNTSPLTGESSLSDQQIIKKVFDDFVLKDLDYMSFFMGNIFHNPDSEEEKKETFLNALHSVDVKRQSGRYINVVFHFKNGFQKSYRLPTLYHKWRNIDDANGLLELSGQKVLKPNLSEIEDPAQQSAQARNTIDKIVDHLKEQIATYEREALSFVNDPEEDLKGMSLHDYYAASFEQLNSVLEVLKGEAVQKSTQTFDFLM